ncbi:MAG: glycosyltransferase family 2 protein [Burkholderiales bacterium]|nr:glycosyltransferase family 2 protein [Burkholderiales bacterium]
MKSAPISVLIPCFCCASTIRRAVDSVFAQTLAPTEVILVDDASDDETPAALRQLERDYHGRISVVPLKVNCGAASARNTGWALATQPYVAFLDADDSWHPEKLRVQYEYMNTHPDIAVCGHGRAHLRDDADPGAPAKNPAATNITATGLLFSNAFSTPTVMAKRTIPFRFPEGQRYVEDAFLWQQVALSGLAIVRLESDLAYIHKAPYGSSGLSGQLWKMERAELANFVSHFRAERIGSGLLAAATLFSLAKFLKRLLVRGAGTLQNKGARA